MHRPIFSLAHVPKLLYKFAGVAGMDAVVAGARCYKNRWIRGTIRIDVVVRTILVQKGVPVLVRIAVLGHPTGTRQQSVKSLHIQQRDGAMNCTPQVGSHHVHVSHEQSAIAASSSGQGLGLANTCFDQVLTDRNKVFVGFVAIFLQGCLVPARTEFSTSSNIGVHVNTPAFQPRQSGGGSVSRSERDFEPTVPIQEGWILAVEFDVFLSDHKVRNFRSVLAGCKLLLDHQIVGIELGREGLEFVNDKSVFLFRGSFFLDLAQVGRIHSARGGVTTGGEPEFIVLFRIDRATTGIANLRLLVTTWNQCDRSSVVPDLVEFQFRLDGVRCGQDQIVFSDREILISCFFRGLE
mmetsp:Transcript_3910/g.6931  ORF Transcript_3910/g.6931 Transcript_3910/m.6931 type:complete len:351 (-) Transcript_3910:1440-2492(-)